MRLMEIGLATDGYAFPDAITEFFESTASTDIAGMSTPVRPPPELGQGDAICLLAVNGVQEKPRRCGAKSGRNSSQGQGGTMLNIFGCGTVINRMSPAKRRHGPPAPARGQRPCRSRSEPEWLMGEAVACYGGCMANPLGSAKSGR
jgi:hypothetical protein